MSNKKISQLPPINTLTGTEVIPVTFENVTFGAPVSLLNEIINLKDLKLDKVNNTPDMDKPVSTAVAGELAKKSDLSHKHTISSVTGLVSELSGKANTVHTHLAADVTDFETAVETKLKAMNITVTIDKPEW